MSEETVGKKVGDYSKETLVEYIEKNFSFAGERLFSDLDFIAKWQEVEKLRLKMEANLAAQAATKDWAEISRLHSQWTKLFERRCALTD